MKRPLLQDAKTCPAKKPVLRKNLYRIVETYVSPTVKNYQCSFLSMLKISQYPNKTTL